MTRCLNVAEIEQLIRGNVWFGRQLWMTWHIRRCELCRAKLDEAREERAFVVKVRGALTDWNSDEE